MKKVLSITLACILCLSIFSFAGCSSLELKEQPDRVVISADKIYPEAIGNYITDISVDIPAITAYMEEYNKNADETAKINYTTIKYNKTADYYYVNDATTDVGMKFRLDATQSITSASIYTGTLDQPGKNVYNIVINAIETSGYKTLMTDQDRALIQYTIDGFNGVSAAKQEVQQLFNKEANFAAKWNNEIAEFEIPVKPTELPKPDSSHTLMEVTFPTVEIPPISLDTTIVEGTHLSDMTPVKPKDFDKIAANINSATSSVAAVQAYTQQNVDMNDLSNTKNAVDDIKINSTIAASGMQLTAASFDALQLATSPETAKLPCTKQIMAGLDSAYKEYAAANVIRKDASSLTLPTSAKGMMDALYAEAQANKTTMNSRGHGAMLFNEDGSLSTAGTTAINNLNTVVSNVHTYDASSALDTALGHQKDAIDAATNGSGNLSDIVNTPQLDKETITNNHNMLQDVTQPAADRLKWNIGKMYTEQAASNLVTIFTNPAGMLNPTLWVNSGINAANGIGALGGEFYYDDVNPGDSLPDKVDVNK